MKEDEMIGNAVKKRTKLNKNKTKMKGKKCDKKSKVKQNEIRKKKNQKKCDKKNEIKVDNLKIY